MNEKLRKSEDYNGLQISLDFCCRGRHSIFILDNQQVCSLFSFKTVHSLNILQKIAWTLKVVSTSAHMMSIIMGDQLISLLVSLVQGSSSIVLLWSECLCPP